MDLFTQILGLMWLYGGAYFSALATTSSFFAVFFFFWTRTGSRKGKETKEAKELYLYPIYWILRFSLGMIILSKVLEVFLLLSFAKTRGIEASVFDIVLSSNAALIYLLLIILAINSAAMVARIANFSYALPLAITSYFFLFIHQVYVNNQSIEGFFTPADINTFINICVYAIAVGVVFIVFNYFSKIVRK